VRDPGALRARCETLRASLRSSGEGNSDFVLEQARSLRSRGLGLRPQSGEGNSPRKRDSDRQPSGTRVPRANLIGNVTSLNHTQMALGVALGVIH